MTRTLAVLLSTLLALGLTDSSGALAAVLHVSADGSGQYPTIQAAIDAAAPGDTVSLADGTYRGDGNRDIEYRGKAITVRSQSDEPALCTIDCQGTASSPHRGFHFCGGEPATAVLRGVTITGGYVLDMGGGIRCQAPSQSSPSSPTLNKCNVRNCFAPLGAGIGVGIKFWDAFPDDDFSNPILIDCDISHNLGDGLFISHLNTDWSQQHRLENCSLNNNSGMGLRIEIPSNSSAIIDNCSALNNGDCGMSLYIEYGQVAIRGGRVSDNGNDGISVCGARIAVVNAVSICRNERHGVCATYESTMEIRDCLISDNGRSGLWSSYHSQTSGCRIVGNGDYGIVTGTGSAVDSCLVYDNNSGGMSLHWSEVGGPVVHVEHCTVANNAGPGIWAPSDVWKIITVTCERSIIAYNWSSIVECSSALGVTAIESDIFGNLGGDWTGCLAGQENDAGNLWADPGFCLGTARPFFLRSDSPCAAENNCGVQIGALPIGCGVTDIGADDARKECLLHQNTPNPFNPLTTLRFDVPVGGRVHLEVYDVAGRLIRTLLDVDLPAGSHQAVWDGKDERGMGVASGSYFARLSADGRVETVRMGLVK